MTRMKCAGIDMPHGVSANCLTCSRFGRPGNFQPLIRGIGYVGASLPVVDCASRVHAESVDRSPGFGGMESVPAGNGAVGVLGGSK